MGSGRLFAVQLAQGSLGVLGHVLLLDRRADLDGDTGAQEREGGEGGEDRAGSPLAV